MSRRGSWGGDKTIHFAKENSYCGGGIHCDADYSCNVFPIHVRNLGAFYWKKCPHYSSTSSKVSNVKYRTSAKDDLNRHDCRDCFYIRASEQFICKNFDSPNFSYKCSKCEYYVKEEILYNGQKITRPEYEYLLEHPSVPSDQELQSTNKDRMPKSK